MSDEYDWADYDSVQLFPGCDCGHDATDHKAAWGDWRWGEGCLVIVDPSKPRGFDDCRCEIQWEHS